VLTNASIQGLLFCFNNSNNRKIKENVLPEDAEMILNQVQDSIREA